MFPYRKSAEAVYSIGMMWNADNITCRFRSAGFEELRDGSSRIAEWGIAVATSKIWGHTIDIASRTVTFRYCILSFNSMRGF